MDLSEIYGICCFQNPKRPRRCWVCFHVVGFERVNSYFLTVLGIEMFSVNQVTFRKSTKVECSNESLKKDVINVNHNRIVLLE